MSFVSNKSLWSARGWKFTQKECVLGERKGHTEGPLGLKGPSAVNTAPRVPGPDSRGEGVLRGQQGRAFRF